MYGKNDNHTRLTLIIKLKSTDNDKAWSEFEEIYSPFIYNLIRRMRLQHHDACDLTQVALTKVWEKIDTYRLINKPGNFRGWLAVVTRNVVRGFIRTKKNFITNRDSINYEEELLDDLEIHQLPKIEELARKEWALYITNMAKETVLPTLHKNKQRVFEMNLDGVKPHDMAKELGITESLVYQYRSEVFALMKKEIKRLNNEL